MPFTRGGLLFLASLVSDARFPGDALEAGSLEEVCMHNPGCLRVRTYESNWDSIFEFSTYLAWRMP